MTIMIRLKGKFYTESDRDIGRNAEGKGMQVYEIAAGLEVGESFDICKKKFTSCEALARILGGQFSSYSMPGERIRITKVE